MKGLTERAFCPQARRVVARLAKERLVKLSA